MVSGPCSKLTEIQTSSEPKSQGNTSASGGVLHRVTTRRGGGGGGGVSQSGKREGRTHLPQNKNYPHVLSALCGPLPAPGKLNSNPPLPSTGKRSHQHILHLLWLTDSSVTWGHSSTTLGWFIPSKHGAPAAALSPSAGAGQDWSRARARATDP